MSPRSAGMSFATSMKKPFEFIGKTVHVEESNAGVQSIRRLFKVNGLTDPGLSPPRSGSGSRDKCSEPQVGDHWLQMS